MYINLFPQSLLQQHSLWPQYYFSRYGASSLIQYIHHYLRHTRWCDSGVLVILWRERESLIKRSTSDIWRDRHYLEPTFATLFKERIAEMT
jgi:hypothetical protein